MWIIYYFVRISGRISVSISVLSQRKHNWTRRPDAFVSFVFFYWIRFSVRSSCGVESRPSPTGAASSTLEAATLCGSRVATSRTMKRTNEFSFIHQTIQKRSKRLIKSILFFEISFTYEMECIFIFFSFFHSISIRERKKYGRTDFFFIPHPFLRRKKKWLPVRFSASWWLRPISSESTKRPPRNTRRRARTQPSAAIFPPWRNPSIFIYVSFSAIEPATFVTSSFRFVAVSTTEGGTKDLVSVVMNLITVFSFLFSRKINRQWAWEDFYVWRWWAVLRKRWNLV